MPDVPALLAVLLAGAALLLYFAAPAEAATPVEIVITGIEGDVLKNVQETLVPPAGIVHGGRVDRLWLDRFVRQAERKVRKAMEPYGLYNARVSFSVKELKGGQYRLQVTVVPGEPVRVAEARVQVTGPGAGHEKLTELVAAFPLTRGTVLLQPLYEEAKTALKTQAQRQGYLDAEFTTHGIRVDPASFRADIDLVLDTGPLYRFDNVRIEGGEKYPAAMVRRNLAFKQGEVFSSDKLAETQLNFNNSEQFSSVKITPEKERAVDHSVPVLVQLKPAARWSLRPGVGYGTDTGGRLTFRYRDVNMLELGHQIHSQFFIAERLQGLATGYTIPDSRDVKTSVTIQLNLQREVIPAYTSRLLALEVARNQSFGMGELGAVYARWQEEDFTIGVQNSSTRLILPGIRFSKDGYDNIYRPTTGYRYGFDLRGTHRYIGSDTDLLQLIADGSHLLPLPWRLVLHTRARSGITLLDNPLAALPPTLRFFAGGDQSVRGYSYKSLGPKDRSGTILGGKHLLTGSVELERLLYSRWGVSAFYDSGNAFNDFDKIKLYQGGGVGVHYYTPIGALNLAVARRLGTADPGLHVHFTVGFEF